MGVRTPSKVEEVPRLQVLADSRPADRELESGSFMDMQGDEKGASFMELPGESGNTKSKVVLLMMEIVPLYICGLDRCYLGSICTGILKGMTLGGFGIWVVVDWLYILPNAIEMLPSISCGSM